MALILALSLASCLLLTLFSTSVKQTQVFAGKDLLFFYLRFQRLFFQRREAPRIFIALRVTRMACFFVFVFALSSLLTQAGWMADTPHEEGARVLVVLFLLSTSILALDIVPSIIGYTASEATFSLTAPFASLLLILFSPLHFLISSLVRRKSDALTYPHHRQGDGVTAQKIMAYLEGDSASGRHLIHAVLDFKDRIAREVMVPRVDLFALPTKTPVKQAVEAFLREGYSRIPVYGEDIDEILGLVMYKDLLRLVIDSPNEPTIEKLVKPILYTPETKKVAALLQDFRAKQMHMALVVDEWGGTEGIVTIEDILEEIVGEIADEYDIDEKSRFTSEGEGSWTVDPKMSLLDVEEWFDVKIPQEGDYDTIGGYVFHKAGAIPKKGFHISHDTFDIEVLDASERAIASVRLIKKAKPAEEEDG